MSKPRECQSNVVPVFGKSEIEFQTKHLDEWMTSCCDGIANGERTQLDAYNGERVQLECMFNVGAIGFYRRRWLVRLLLV